MDTSDMIYFGLTILDTSGSAFFLVTGYKPTGPDDMMFRDGPDYVGTGLQLLLIAPTTLREWATSTYGERDGEIFMRNIIDINWHGPWSELDEAEEAMAEIRDRAKGGDGTGDPYLDYREKSWFSTPESSQIGIQIPDEPKHGGRYN